MSKQYQVRGLATGEVIHFEDRASSERVSTFRSQATAERLAITAAVNGGQNTEIVEVVSLPVFVTRIRQTEAGTYRWSCESSFGDLRDDKRSGIHQSVYEAELAIKHTMKTVIDDIDLELDIDCEYRCRQCNTRPARPELDGHCVECMQSHELFMAELGV